MPSINIAMERSLGGKAIGFLATSLRPALERRGITDTANDVKNSFSSWDNCMAATYCKWPVIALIIVGGLIILSVLICLFRCLCLAKSCCCACFSCLKCCGNCCGCCDPPKGAPHKHLDDTVGYHNAAPTQPYRANAPMTAGPTVPTASTAFAAHEPPKYAEFDISKKGSSGNDDALPAMPTWDQSATTKVMVEETVELEPMTKPAASVSNLHQQGVPLMGAATSGPASPMSPAYRGDPYGRPNGAAPGPYGWGGTAAHDPYSPGQPGVYGQQQSTASLDQGYGHAGAIAMGQGRRTPGHSDNGRSPYGPEKGHGSSYDDYNNQGYARDPHNSPYGRDLARRPSAPQQGGFGYDNVPGRSPSAVGHNNYGYDNSPRRSPAPQGDYGYNDGHDIQALQRDHYSPLNSQSGPQLPNLGAMPPAGSTSPLNKSSGVGFGSDHGRSQQQGQQGYKDGYGGRPQPPSRQNTGGYRDNRSPQPLSRINTGDNAYPGFRAYSPGAPNGYR